MESNFNVLDLWVLKMGGGYKLIKKELLKVIDNPRRENNSHEEVFRDEHKVITEKRMWDRSWSEGDTQFEYDFDGSKREAWEESKPQYIKDGFNFLETAQREWIPEEYDRFIAERGPHQYPLLNMCLDNTKIIYTERDYYGENKRTLGTDGGK